MKKALALLALMASCSAPSVTVVPAVIENSLTGSVSASTTGEITASMQNDLSKIGLGGSKSVFAPKIDLNFLSSELSLSQSSTSFAGRGELDGEFDLGDNPMAAGVEVDSEMDVTAMSFLWTFNFVNTDTAHFGVGLGATALDMYLDVNQVGTSPTHEPFDEVLPVPMIGVRAGGDLGPIRLSGSYATLEIKTDEGEFLASDFDVYAAYDFFGDTGSLVFGMRSFDFDVSYKEDGDSVAMDLGLGGPYVGIRLSF